MIVWNAGRRFFPLKADAETHRKTHNLPPAIKVEIDGREDLAALLNGLCAIGEDQALRATDPEIAADIPANADVPKFLRDAWAKLEARST